MLYPGSSAKEVHKKYHFKQKIGQGAFSEVVLATNIITGKDVAIKKINKCRFQGKRNMPDAEVKVFQKVNHEYIIKLHEVFEDEEEVYLVMDLVKGGELFNRIVNNGRCSESECSRIVNMILQAVKYLHDSGIVHRDLKPENLLLSDNTANSKIVISDFGLSKFFSNNEEMETACGTPGYVAPEVLKRSGYGKGVDLWSTGVITYILLCGYPPFYGKNDAEIYTNIIKGNFKFDELRWNNISACAKHFVSQLLVTDPNQRMTAVDALNHGFILMHQNSHLLASPPLAIDSSSSDKSRSGDLFGSMKTKKEFEFMSSLAGLQKCTLKFKKNKESCIPSPSSSYPSKSTNSVNKSSINYMKIAAKPKKFFKLLFRSKRRAIVS